MPSSSSPSSSVLRIAEGAVVCDGAAAKPPYHQHPDGRGAAAPAPAGATLTGDITIGPETVVFPGAEVRCCEGAGPVVIGRGCVLEEGARLVNLGPGEMRVGDGNLFEVGCTMHAQQVGDYNTFQPKCEVGRGVTVASGCSIGPTVALRVVLKLEDNSSVFRLGGAVDEYSIQRRPRNSETNRARVKTYRAALASQGKKYYLGKYHKLLPPSADPARDQS
ncbi:unnamed protein product [Pylaiella littoralis]